MHTLSERSEDDKKLFQSKDGLFDICLSMDYQHFLQEWGLEEYPMRYEEISIEEIEYLLRGHYVRDGL